MQKCSTCGEEWSITSNPFDPDIIYIECPNCGISEGLGTLKEVVLECLAFREITPIIDSMYEGISSAEELEEICKQK